MFIKKLLQKAYTSKFGLKTFIAAITPILLTSCTSTREVYVDECDKLRDYNCRPVHERYIPLPEREIGREYIPVREEVRVYRGDRPRRGFYRREYR